MVHTMTTPTQIVDLLREASIAYYNGGVSKMSDDTYDGLVDRLRELDPANPYLTEVGAPAILTGAVKLPYAMPSLDKIKPGQDQLTRFLLNTSGFVLSEKLDGLSALWIPKSKKLFLRGDGTVGQDISHLVPLGIQGLSTKSSSCAIRGELILPRIEGQALARNWVNGMIHRSDPSPDEVKKIRFVAYELLHPALPRAEQFPYMHQQGFEVAWYSVVPTVTVLQLEIALKERRLISPYDTDGIVVGLQSVPKSESTAAKAKNPKDCVAFKMPLVEQSAVTTVREVLWAPSAQGYLIPRIRFDPVTIGAATIEFCTGHNARMILTESVGPDATIRICRSGDVIPKLEAVLVPAPVAALPPTGTWEWVGPSATASHIRTLEAGDAVLTAKLHYFLKTLDIPGSGPATATALVAAGIRDPKTLLEKDAIELSKVLGPKTGASLFANLRTALTTTGEIRLMVASSMMPRSVGETKLTSLFGVQPNPAHWNASLCPAGWTRDSLTAFMKEFPKYMAWRQAQLGSIPFPAKGLVLPGSTTHQQPTGVSICMSGFRDKDLEEKATAKGHNFTLAVTAKTTLLLVPDGEVKESEKVKAAKAKGIRILGRSQFVQQYLS